MFEKIINSDQELFLLLNFDGGRFADEFFRIVSGRATWIPLYILIIVLLWRWYGWKYTLAAVIFMALMVGMADMLANLFKGTVQRLRPSHEETLKGLIHIVDGYTGGRFGTLSAHVATTFSIAIFSSSLIRARWFTVTMLIWILLVAYSRVYLGLHYPLDLFFGALSGIAIGFVSVRVFRWSASKVQGGQFD